ncbi:lipopolysaccharide biosynthesis protein [Streptococcus parasuis]|uniref:lipopolysaccharide biosynthesis protein n=1 Tax=Streptococcus parasuis TaxID=1501662 RepID=UPI0028AAB196|nr:lipopolysaccharide biosynthesis protein [Streptococcus parasuis]
MDIAKSFKAGVLYNALGKYSNVIIQLVVTSILSRMLSPKEYGLVAVVNVFLIFFQMIADSGIGPAIIQEKSLIKQDIQHIFTLTIYIGLLLSILFAFLGIPLSYLYKNEIYINLSFWLGLCVLFYSLSIVPQAVLSKNLRFKNINISVIISNLVSAIVGITMAYLGFGVYSLIGMNILKAALLFIFYYSQERIPFSFKTSRQSIAKIFEFSKFQFLFNLINYFARNLDNLLIGSIINSTALGYYDKAYQLSLYPNQVLSQVITPIMHPIMSNFSSDKDKLKDVFILVSRIMIALGIPISVFLSLNARDIIFFMFGENWAESVTVFRLLSLTIWLQMANSFLSSFYQSTDNTKLLFRVGNITSGINILAIIIGILLGDIENIAQMLVVSFSLVLIISLVYLKKFLDFTVKVYLSIILKNVLIIFPYIILEQFIFDFHFGSFYNIVASGVMLFTIWSFGMLLTKEYKNFINFSK